jgi:hypothetical protein
MIMALVPFPEPLRRKKIHDWHAIYERLLPEASAGGHNVVMALLAVRTASSWWCTAEPALPSPLSFPLRNIFTASGCRSFPTRGLERLGLEAYEG